MTADMQIPDTFLMSTIAGIRGDPFLPVNPLDDYIADIVKLRPEYKHRGEENDKLFMTEYVHEGSGNDTCERCNGPQVLRARPPGIKVPYGLIASGNQLLGNAKLRDDIGSEFNVLCFEMEAAGVVKTGQCLAIRGISVYADSHKNDQWQENAAAAAAAYAKFFLSRMRNSEIQVRTPSFLDEPKLAQKRAAAFSNHNIHKKQEIPAKSLTGKFLPSCQMNGGKSPSPASNARLF